jgi:hypothetical protein
VDVFIIQGPLSLSDVDFPVSESRSGGLGPPQSGVMQAPSPVTPPAACRRTAGRRQGNGLMDEGQEVVARLQTSGCSWLQQCIATATRAAFSGVKQLRSENSVEADGQQRETDAKGEHSKHHSLQTVLAGSDSLPSLLVSWFSTCGGDSDHGGRPLRRRLPAGRRRCRRDHSMQVARRSTRFCGSDTV